MTLGNNSTGDGTLTIDGPDSTFTAGAGGLVVGDVGIGALNVKTQGMLKVSDDVIVGAQSTGMGTVTVSAGGTADISGSLTIGGGRRPHRPSGRPRLYHDDHAVADPGTSRPAKLFS